MAETGLYGGSFNPPHRAHVAFVEYALERWGLGAVIVVPAFQHPFAKDLAPFEDRLAMTRLAFEPFGARAEVSAIEQERGGVSYTIDTIRGLHAARPGLRLRLLAGSDVLHEAEKWREFDAVQREAPLLVVPRAGFDAPEGVAAPLPDVRSSRIRAALLEGVAPEDLPLPAAVAAYIRQQGLYGTAPRADLP